VVKWGRSEDGYVRSKCGRWQITPLFWGCVRPQQYQLKKDGELVGTFPAQRDAKHHADYLTRGDSCG
jgi:hypothetical protein